MSVAVLCLPVPHSLFLLITVLPKVDSKISSIPREQGRISLPTLQELVPVPVPAKAYVSLSFAYLLHLPRANTCPMLQVFRFTSQFSIVAVGAQVVNGTTPRPGPADAVGYFNYGINAAEDTICYVRPPLLSTSPSLANPNADI